MRPGSTTAVSRLLLGAIVLVGVLIRLNQFNGQVLLDDEWHAIHQLLSGKSPAELFLSFGFADYSIPLGLLYWVESSWFGLSEWGMRWPMLLAGVATLVALPAYAWRRFSPRVAIVFAALLALSPMLLIYSRTARPYALTLVLSVSCVYFFYRYLDATGRGTRWLVLYTAGFSLCVWLHPVSAPLLLAPLLLEGGRGLFTQAAPAVRRVLTAGISAGLLTAVLILPPLLNGHTGPAWSDSTATLKWETLSGAVYFWLGTPSLVCALALMCLALLGLPQLLRTSRVSQSVLLGLALTVMAIVVIRPASVNHPVTFGRYLLAAIPFLALAAALGAERLMQSGRVPGRVVMMLLAVVSVLYLYKSPLRTLLAYPNSQTNHSVFQADFRSEKNKILKYQQATLQTSPFWQGLAGLPQNSQVIAVAPFYFESYNWGAPRWERLSQQRVVPAFLSGFCAEGRNGEVDDDGRFPLRNAYWLSRLESGGGNPPDWLVLTNPIPRFSGTPEGDQMRSEAQVCQQALKDRLGGPDYQDEVLLAWHLKQ